MVYLSLDIPSLMAPFCMYYGVVSRPRVRELSKGFFHAALLGRSPTSLIFGSVPFSLVF